MSIINDALKKAGNLKDLEPLHGQGELRQNIGFEVQKKQRQINWGPIFVLMVLFLITGPLIAPVFSTSFKRPVFFGSSAPSKASYEVPIEAASVPASTSLQNRKTQFGLEEIPMAVPPKLNLTGIVFSQEGSYCILNDKVMRTGEESGGAKLTKVSPGEVKLLYQGEEITLSVPE